MGEWISLQRIVKANQHRAKQPATAPLLTQLTLPDALSLGNLLAGTIAIFAAMQGKLDTAAAAMLVAVVLDALDGKLARKVSAVHDLGKQLDSLSDLVSFGLAPAVFVYAHIGEAIPGVVLPTTLLVLCGALRLARFNTLNLPYYLGMPITANGIIFPMLYDLHAPAGVFIGVALLSAALMVSSIRLEKKYLRLAGSAMIIIWATLHLLGIGW